MIKGICVTNLDDYYCVDFPMRFVSVPRVGDWIRSVKKCKELKVVRVTHLTIRYRKDGETIVEPRIEIELNR